MKRGENAKTYKVIRQEADLAEKGISALTTELRNMGNPKVQGGSCEDCQRIPETNPHGCHSLKHHTVQEELITRRWHIFYIQAFVSQVNDCICFCKVSISECVHRERNKHSYTLSAI